MKHQKLWALLLTGISFPGYAQSSNPYADGTAAAPDEWLLVSKGSPWWYTTKPSPNPVRLRQRTPNAAEQAVIDRARQLVGNRPAKAFVLMDGDTILYSETKAPANNESVFFGFSMGKTVTAMAVGQAICAGRLQLTTKASDLVPELSGKALGNATARDLLRECQDFCVRGVFRNWLLVGFYSMEGPCQAAGGPPGLGPAFAGLNPIIWHRLERAA